jgi:hypothetical protein
MRFWGMALDTRQRFGQRFSASSGVVVGLKSAPETFAHAEEGGQTQAGVHGHAPLSRHDFADAPLGHANFLGQAVLADAQRLEKFFQQNFAWMGIRDFAWHGDPSVVVDDLDMESVAGLETKADTPLVIDADAVLAGPIAREFFQPVARRHAQVIQRFRPIQYRQLAHGAGGNVGEFLNTPSMKQRFGIGMTEARNHASMLSLVDTIVKQH